MPFKIPSSRWLHRNRIARLGEEDSPRYIATGNASHKNPDLEIEKISKAILRLREWELELLLQRGEHAAIVHRRRVRLCSIPLLPEDVLSLIFRWSVPIPEDWSIGLQESPHPIVNLSHVCREWRAIVLSTPALWATISISSLPRFNGYDLASSHHFQEKMQRLKEMISTFISRTTTCPLVLSLNLDDRILPPRTMYYGMGAQCVGAVRSVVDVLWKAQWKHVDIYVRTRDRGSPFRKLLDIPPHSKSTIQSARFCTYSDGAITETLTLENTVELRSLDISASKPGLFDVRLNLAGLSELKLLCAVPVQQVPGVFGGCPNLVRCAVELELWDISSPAPDLDLPTVTLEHLHTLAILGFQPTIDLARSLVLPSLRVLSIFDTTHPQDTPLDIAIPEWVRLYGAQLERIAFRSDRLDEPTLISCLKRLPNVISLDIPPPLIQGKPGLPRSALLGMTPKVDPTGELADEAYWCQRLKYIAIDGTNPSISPEDWVAFITRRRSQIHAPEAYLWNVNVYIHGEDTLHGDSRDTSITQVLTALEKENVSLDGVMFYCPPVHSFTRTLSISTFANASFAGSFLG